MGHDGSKALVVAEAAGAGVEGFGGGGGYFHPLTLKASGNAEGGPPSLSFRRWRDSWPWGVEPCIHSLVLVVASWLANFYK